ncbi:MAG: hypothetical protein R3F43_12265 [bacterium]
MLFARWHRIWGTEELPGLPLRGAAGRRSPRSGPRQPDQPPQGHARGGVPGRPHRRRGPLPRADLDTDQFAYEVWGQLVAYQHYRRLLGDPETQARAQRAFRGLIEASRT